MELKNFQHSFTKTFVLTLWDPEDLAPSHYRSPCKRPPLRSSRPPSALEPYAQTENCKGVESDPAARQFPSSCMTFLSLQPIDTKSNTAGANQKTDC